MIQQADNLIPCSVVIVPNQVPWAAEAWPWPIKMLKHASNKKYQSTLDILALGIMALGILTLGIMALCILALGIMALGILAPGKLS